jgi:hypothetical protein
MVGIGTFFEEQKANSFARDLGNLARISARPTFELQFNILQNQLLSQLSDKIEKLNDTSANTQVDAFLKLEKSRLNRLRPLIGRYENSGLLNHRTVNDFSIRLPELKTLASGGDAAAFDAFLDKMNADASRLKKLNGYTIGFYAKDGLEELRRDGFAINSYASYATDADREAALDAAITKNEASLTVLVANMNAVQTFRSRIDGDLTGVVLQIESTLAADQAEKIAEIQKLREDHGRFVKVLSLAFEGAAAKAESISKQLLDPPTRNTGTVLDFRV